MGGDGEQWSILLRRAAEINYSNIAESPIGPLWRAADFFAGTIGPELGRHYFYI